MTIEEVLIKNPKTADVLREMGMQCLGCPSARGESVAGAARTHGIDEKVLLEKLNAVEQGEMSPETAADRMPPGSILQRDKETFAIAPHIPGGVTNAATLRKIADVAEKYNAAVIKVTHGQRIAIVGLKKEDVEPAWADLGLPAGAANGICIRYVNFCPGTTFCKRGQQDAVGLGLELDKRYHGVDTPSKMKIAVSGCTNSCTEPSVRDIGIMGTPRGFNVLVGGNAGLKPRFGDTIAEHLDGEEVLNLVDKVVSYYKQHGGEHERIGTMIDRIGLDKFKQDVIEK